MIVFQILLCTLSAGFFAGLETGLLSADQLAIYLKKENGVFYARAADFLLLRPERLLATTLIGTNISVVTAAILFAAFLRRFGLSWGSWAGSLVLSLFLLIFSEIIPKTFFRRHADNIGTKMAPVLVLFYFLFLPVSFVLNMIVNGLLFLFGQYERKSKLPQSREDLRLLVRLGSREFGLDRSDQRVFEDIFDFRDTLAREVMIQIHEYPVCHIDSSPKELVKLALEKGIRFVPIYRERADNITGYVDIEEMLGFETANIKDKINEAVYYPDTKRIPDLLLEMNTKKIEVVFLSDEYGAISGLITPAEIATEIVGFIPGEQIEKLPDIQVLSPGYYRVAGTTDIEDIKHETGILIEKGNYDTIGGFLCERLGEIPGLGVIYEENGMIYRVIDRDDRHIKKVEIKRKEKNEA